MVIETCCKRVGYFCLILGLISLANLCHADTVSSIMGKRGLPDGVGAKEVWTDSTSGNVAHDKGFRGQVMIGMNAGGNVTEILPLLSLEGEYNIRHWMNIGIGSGFEEKLHYRQVPLYLLYKAYLRRDYKGLYAYGGYGYPKVWINKDLKGTVELSEVGEIYKCGFGFIFDDSRAVGWALAIGWSQQRLEEEFEGYYSWSTEFSSTIHRRMNRLEFKIGIYF